MSIKKERDPFFDNARFILVVLVVFGHFISPVRTDHPVIYEINNFLSLFRMPALIILTGFLSKGFLRDGYIEKITKRILIPFFIFQVAYAYYYHYLYERTSTLNYDLLSPQYTLWFLLALFVWNLLLFVFTRIKYPLLYAVIIGVFIGYSDGAGHYFAIHRIFTFFPFFLLGFYMKKEHFEWVKRPMAKVVGAVLLVGVWIAIEQLFTLQEARAWVLGNANYTKMGYIRWDIGLGRLMMYALSLSVAFAFLAFVPKKKTFFTHLGTRTAYIYILHGGIVRTVYEKYLPDQFTTVDYWMLPLYALALALILGSKPVNVVMKPFIEGKIVDYIFYPFRKIGAYLQEPIARQKTKLKEKMNKAA
ncbi:acyltransferase family protein [Anaerobacillus sp. CMMVII]|uniref:acyltransferase family protein n=1 Tax=Anaerobacillus sp. CMMVII TaxID=2755588 RepID=UPI0021B7B939|nr:acyltransferase family protein [Anaerobacillus sp. CMMVII]MCT8140329.1 acyltransferase family protein [Anaerobacillus sp. CMMVII]